MWPFQQKHQRQLNCWIAGDSQKETFDLPVNHLSLHDLRTAIMAKKAKDPRFTHIEPELLCIWQVCVIFRRSEFNLTTYPKVSIPGDAFNTDINPRLMEGSRQLTVLSGFRGVTLPEHLHLIIELPSDCEFNHQLMAF